MNEMATASALARQNPAAPLAHDDIDSIDTWCALVESALIDDSVDAWRTLESTTMPIVPSDADIAERAKLEARVVSLLDRLVSRRTAVSSELAEVIEGRRTLAVRSRAIANYHSIERQSAIDHPPIG